MEMKLSVYDELLGTVRANMNKLSKDYTAIMIWDRNLNALLFQVTDIVVSIIDMCLLYIHFMLGIV